MIKDTHKLQGFDKFKMPKLHGHVKIKTYYPLSGNIAQIVEGDNIITNAVRDIFANNYMGCLDNSKILPIWQTWYGGVLCYQSAHPTNNGQLDPDVYFPQSDLENALIAHAGRTAIDPLHDDDSTRGNPVMQDYVATMNSIKQVWEWGTSHGNGVISALSLTHTDTGSYGLGNAGYAFKNSFYPFAAIQSSVLANVTTGNTSLNNNLVAMYDETRGIGFHIGGADEYVNGHFAFETDTITIYINRLAYTKAGLFDTTSAQSKITIAEEDFNIQTQFVVEDLPFKLYGQPAYDFDYETKYLWIFNNINGMTEVYSGAYKPTDYSNTVVKYVVIDCNEYDSEPQSRIVTNGTITSDTANIAPTSDCVWRYNDSSFSGGYYARFIKDGNFVYIPTTGGNIDWGIWSYGEKFDFNGFKKINIASQSQQSQISFNDNRSGYVSAIKCGGIIISNNRVINGNTGYTCQMNLGANGDTDNHSALNWHFQTPDKISSLVFPIYYGGDSSQPRYILANKMVNTTKYNLPSAIQKSASQAMSVEYVLSEVSDDE